MKRMTLQNKETCLASETYNPGIEYNEKYNLKQILLIFVFYVKSWFLLSFYTVEPPPR